METLSRPARSADEGNLLPDVFPAFRRLGMRPRRGAVTMIAAESKQGKTFLAMYYVAATRLRTLYFSADADRWTMRVRAAAMMTGLSQETVGQDLDHYAENLRPLDERIRWVFESDPTYEDIELGVAAYAEAYGDYPEIVVVDNLMNVVGEAENEYSAMRDTTRLLHWLCRHAGCAVLVLHHMREEGKIDDYYPPAKNRIDGKVSKFPEEVYSLALDPIERRMRISPVASRFCEDDKTGRHLVAEIYVDLSRAQFFNSKFDMQTGKPA